MTESPFSSPLVKTVVIVGVGMIGGSLAAALKSRNVAERVIGVGRDPRRIESAREAGLIDEAVTDIRQVISCSDLVVFCTPVENLAADVQAAVADLCQTVADPGSCNSPKLPLMTDVGSVKGSICSQLTAIPQFIGSHPIAGSHRQGFEAANPNLFEDRLCILTPLPGSTADSVRRLEQFWQAIGMKTLQMSPEAHDEALAMTSHLPHVVASALAMTLSPENRHLTGSGFRDTTRIAAGDPDLWAGILLNNSQYVMRGIDDVIHRLSQVREALARNDVSEVRHQLAVGQESRKSLDGTKNSTT